MESVAKKIDPAGITLRHVAALAGVSRHTAGAILGDKSHLFRDETRERVRAAAKQVGYRPNAAARAILTKQTKHIGVLVCNSPKVNLGYWFPFPHTYFTILGMNQALEAAGYVLCLIRVDDVEQELTGGSRVFRENVLDGMIVTTMIAQPLCDAVEALVPACVWADTNVWRPTHCVRRDEILAGETAARAALDAGYRKILLVTDDKPLDDCHYSKPQRDAGVQRACEAGGAEFSCLETRWDWTPELIGKLSPFMRPDVAIIGFDIERLRLVSRAASECRLIPGVEFGLACCDSAPEIEYGWPDLARVEFDRFALGAAAAEMMLKMLRPPAGSSQADALRSVLLADPWINGASLGTTR